MSALLLNKLLLSDKGSTNVARTDAGDAGDAFLLDHLREIGTIVRAR
jgi:hypothetical protein